MPPASKKIMTDEIKFCMFCGSSDGAVNEVCNFHYMILQNDPDMNDYLTKHEAMYKAKTKLLEKFLQKN